MQTVTDQRPTTEQRDEAPLRIRYRVRFAKTGLLRWTSHRDLARLWERLIRRAELKPSMSEGFHPKPRIGFPSALALGVEGLDEVVELDLAEEPSEQELFDRLSRDEQPGLQILSVVRLPERSGKAQLLQTDYLIDVPDSADSSATRQAIEQLMSQSTVSVDRKKKTLTFDLPSQILTLELGEDQLLLSLAASDAASLRPTDVLDLIGAGDWIENGASIKRTRVLLQKEYKSSEKPITDET